MSGDFMDGILGLISVLILGGIFAGGILGKVMVLILL